MNPVFVMDLESARQVLTAHPSGVPLIGVSTEHAICANLFSVQQAVDFFTKAGSWVVVRRDEVKQVHLWAKETCNALGEACQEMDADALGLLEKWSKA